MASPQLYNILQLLYMVELTCSATRMCVLQGREFLNNFFRDFERVGCNAVLFADTYLDSGHILDEMCKVNYYFESCYFVNSCYTVI